MLDWELTVADTRIHGTTRRQVGKHFAEVERAALVPLPLAPFPSFQESRRTVHRDGHVEVERAYYAVPPEYLAREVWVRWDARLVRIFNERMEPDRRARQERARPLQHPTRATSPRRRSAGSSVAPRGSWAR